MTGFTPAGRRSRWAAQHPDPGQGSIATDSACRFRCVLICVKDHTLATNLSLDPDLLDRALALSGERTKKAAVTKALQEFIARRQQKRLLELMGKLEWDEGFDYKAERSRR
jgi:Bacterial antitoxin of type II TA system, VapB